jgi:aldehyde dehydrogenase (NAD+)
VLTVDDAIAYINRGPKPLALYVFSRDKRAQERVIASTSAGGSTVNHVWLHLGVPHLPFGGVGDSGTGAYHGRHSFETFSHRRAVLKKPALPDPPLLFPPYSSSKLRWIKRLL